MPDHAWLDDVGFRFPKFRNSLMLLAKSPGGFTLMELLVVISLVGLLATLVAINVRESNRKSQAAKIAADYKTADTAWRLWQIDSGGDFFHEDTYGNTNIDAPCHDEPVLSQTDLFQNVSGSSEWSGPYLGQIPRDPWGRQYSFDNDNDLWQGSSNKWGGVNIQLQWCAGEQNRYLSLAPLIDQIYDDGDGSDNGVFRWDNTAGAGGYGILVSPYYTE